MAFEIPTDLISKTKILIRKEAKISSYNSDDPSLLELPSLEETIAQLNPSPPYLRCNHCKGRLLRDLESIICIFCGKSQITGVHPEAINFRNTVGCRWLLESLELNGSEMAGPFIDVKEAKRGEPLNEFPLSDLLDLEIKWSPKSEKVETSSSNESNVGSKGPLNLDGVDLDNFFSEGKEDKTSVLAEEQSTINKLTNKNDSDSDTVQPNEQLSLFEDFKPPEINKSTDPESRDSFSGWEASFQSASSSMHNKDSKSIDPFAASSSDVSMQIDLVFGPQEGSTRGKAKDEETLSSSMSDDWFQNDLWSNPRSTQHEQVDVIAEVGHKNLTENTNNSMSSSVDWGKEDHWPARKQEPDNKTVDNDDDSSDAWNDFTSSISTPYRVNSSWNQAFEDPVPSVKEISEIDYFSSVTTVNDVDFSNPSHPGAFNHQNGSAGVEPLQLETSLYRNGKEVNTSEDNVKGLDISVTKEGDNINVAKSNSDDVQRLLAQMHDLSFMLENNLSIPPK